MDSERSIDFVGPNDGDSEPSWKRGYVCFSRNMDGTVCMTVGRGSDSWQEINLNQRDLQLLSIYVQEAMRPRPGYHEMVGEELIRAMVGRRYSL